jgi:hypothetical protein
MTEKFKIVWMGARRAEDGCIHLWGYGRYARKAYSFWRLKRTDSIQFKDVETYSWQTRRTCGNDIKAMRDEKICKGYQRLKPSPSRRKRIHTAFLVAIAFTGLHSRRRAD